MKQYYLERIHWIFRYRNKKFFYALAKTLCLIVGVPIYAVMFVVEMVLTGINMIFSWIPILNVVVSVICKSIIFLTDKTFYICILTDIKEYRRAMKNSLEYDVSDADESDLKYEEQVDSIVGEEHKESDETATKED